MKSSCVVISSLRQHILCKSRLHLFALRENNLISTIPHVKPPISSHPYRSVFTNCALWNTLESRTGRTLSKEQKHTIAEGPGLKDFIVRTVSERQEEVVNNVPYLNSIISPGNDRKVFLDVFGCQMNVNDAEVVMSILSTAGFVRTLDTRDADVILVVTCAIREGAEAKVFRRLEHLRGLKRARARTKAATPMKIAVLGCMAERLKHRLLEAELSVDVVAGPDSYADLPRLLDVSNRGQAAINVLLSLDETYADITPVRLNPDLVTAFVTVMRGCDNMCSYCIVPFVRGRERSRPMQSIIREVRHLAKQGVKEITLLGQNVNSYRDMSSVADGERADLPTETSPGFDTVYRRKVGGTRFAALLSNVAAVDPEMRVRFTSPHPKDFPDQVLSVIASHPNVCCSLHLPAQSGNSAVLERMRRGYSREAYLALVDRVRRALPRVALSSDFIAGFCGETDAEFEETLSLIDSVGYHTAYLFPYSMREKTTAHRRFKDDVPAATKHTRLLRMVESFRSGAEKLNRAEIGETHLVLVEGRSKRSADSLAGRNDANLKVVFPRRLVPIAPGDCAMRTPQPGDYVAVQITSATSQTLIGSAINLTSLQKYYASKPLNLNQHCFETETKTEERTVI